MPYKLLATCSCLCTMLTDRLNGMTRKPHNRLVMVSKNVGLVTSNFVERSMLVDPLLNAPHPVQLHAIPAIAAFVLGAIQFLGPKGTVPHRALGWIWVVLMALVAISSFNIHTICTVGPFSPIHLLSIITIVALPIGVWRAPRHKIKALRRSMQLLYLGALIIAGAFTFYPGRIMHDVAFGVSGTHGTCS